MIETTKQSSSTVQDPVCGMTIDPARAFATRTLGEETFYFCSERCVQQFDREHTGSASTGVARARRRLRVELPISDGDGRHGAARLQEQLETMPGVAQAVANPKTNLLRVTYDPSAIALEAIVDRIRERGYTPDVVVMQHGKPVRFNFRREETAACSEMVVFNDFGKSAQLPTGETVPIEFLPEKPGEYEFTCQMGMLRSKLIVE